MTLEEIVYCRKYYDGRKKPEQSALELTLHKKTKTVSAKTEGSSVDI